MTTEKRYIYEKKLKKVAREKQQEAMVEDIAEKIIYEYLEIELPENWYQRPTTDRVQFIQDVLNGEENVFEEENVKFTPRLVVTSKEIYQEAFNKPLNNVLDARSNSDIRKIGLIMNSHPGGGNKTSVYLTIRQRCPTGIKDCSI